MADGLIYEPLPSHGLGGGDTNATPPPATDAPAPTAPGAAQMNDFYAQLAAELNPAASAAAPLAGSLYEPLHDVVEGQGVFYADLATGAGAAPAPGGFYSTLTHGSSPADAGANPVNYTAMPGPAGATVPAPTSASPNVIYGASLSAGLGMDPSGVPVHYGSDPISVLRATPRHAAHHGMYVDALMYAAVSDGGQYDAVVGDMYARAGSESGEGAAPATGAAPHVAVDPQESYFSHQSMVGGDQEQNDGSALRGALEAEHIAGGIRHWTQEYVAIATDPNAWAGKEASADTGIKIGMLGREFSAAVSRIAVRLVHELHLPNDQRTIPAIDAGGVAGGVKYCTEGIFFKFAVDSHGIYGGDENAMKAVSHELRGIAGFMTYQMQHFQDEPVKMMFPLMVSVDYLGHRLLASSLLPTNDSTLIYGSDDAGKTVHASVPEVNEWFKRAAKFLNLKGHNVVSSSGQKEMMYAPGDIEVHRDPHRPGIYYLLDGHRVFPPAPPRPDRGSHLYELLRPELVRRSEAPLCSDAFSRWGLDQSDKDTFKKHNQEVTDAMRLLTDKLIPEFGRTSSVLRSFVNLKDMDAVLLLMREMIVEAHRFGINIRYLGVVRNYVENPAWRSLLLMELVTRYFKNTLRKGLRRLLEQAKPEDNIPSLSASYIARTVSVWFGAGSEGLWRDVVAPGLGKSKFIDSPALQEGLLQELAAGTFPFRICVARLLYLSGVRLARGAVDRLVSGGQLLLAPTDVVELRPQLMESYFQPFSLGFSLQYGSGGKVDYTIPEYHRIASCYLHAMEMWPQCLPAVSNWCGLLGDVIRHLLDCGDTLKTPRVVALVAQYERLAHFVATDIGREDPEFQRKFYYNYGTFLFRIVNDSANAQKYFEEALRIDPKHHRSYAAMVLMHEEAGRREEADACWAKAMEYCPGMVTDLVEQADFQFHHVPRRREETLALMRRILAHPDFGLSGPAMRAQAYDLMALLHQEFDEAACFDYFTESHRLNPKFGVSARAIADKFKRNQQLAQCMRVFEIKLDLPSVITDLNVIKAIPPHVLRWELWLVLGDVCRLRYRSAEAAFYFERGLALKDKADNARAADIRAHHDAEDGELDAGVSAMLDPEGYKLQAYMDSLFNLALLCDSRGGVLMRDESPRLPGEDTPAEYINRAIEAFRRYLAIRPNDMKARVNLAAAFWHNGIRRIELAEKEYDIILAHYGLPDPPTTSLSGTSLEARVAEILARRTEALTQAMQEIGNPTWASDNFADFVVALYEYYSNEVKDELRANALLMRVLCLRDDSARLLVRLAALKRSVHQAEFALALHMASARVRPTSSRVALQYGWTLFSVDSFEAAISWFRQALTNHANDPLHPHELAECKYKMGVSLLQLNRDAEAIEPLQGVLKTSYHFLYVDALQNIGVAYLHLRQLEDAEATYQSILRMEPGNMLARERMVLIFYNTNRKAEAVPHLVEICKADQENTKLRLQLAMCYFDTGRSVSARTYLLQAQAIAGRNNDAELNQTCQGFLDHIAGMGFLCDVCNAPLGADNRANHYKCNGCETVDLCAACYNNLAVVPVPDHRCGPDVGFVYMSDVYA